MYMGGRRRPSGGLGTLGAGRKGRGCGAASAHPSLRTPPTIALPTTWASAAGVVGRGVGVAGVRCRGCRKPCSVCERALQGLPQALRGSRVSPAGVVASPAGVSGVACRACRRRRQWSRACDVGGCRMPCRGLGRSMQGSWVGVWGSLAFSAGVVVSTAGVADMQIGGCRGGCAMSCAIHQKDRPSWEGLG